MRLLKQLRTRQSEHIRLLNKQHILTPNKISFNTAINCRTIPCFQTTGNDQKITLPRRRFQKTWCPHLRSSSGTTRSAARLGPMGNICLAQVVSQWHRFSRSQVFSADNLLSNQLLRVCDRLSSLKTHQEISD